MQSPPSRSACRLSEPASCLSRNRPQAVRRAIAPRSSYGVSRGFLAGRDGDDLDAILREQRYRDVHATRVYPDVGGRRKSLDGRAHVAIANRDGRVGPARDYQSPVRENLDAVVLACPVADLSLIHI